MWNQLIQQNPSELDSNPPYFTVTLVLDEGGQEQNKLTSEPEFPHGIFSEQVLPIVSGPTVHSLKDKHR